MTTEKAIQLLHRIADEQFDGEYGDERREALSMAVRALEGDGDTISRKMAIESFEPTHYKDWYTPTIIDTLETLPSVQPEVLACGCGELVQESGDLVKELVNDCISRQDVLNELDGCDYELKEWQRWKLKTMVRDIPSAQPDLDEWCPDCKEYDSKRHCCPRFNRVIRGALKDAQPQWIPCDLCKYNPPSSMDGKPCTICPAVGRGESDE